MKTLRFLSFAAGIAILFSGCTGKEGPAGPQGPAGYNGVANIDIQTFDVQAWTAGGGSSYFYATAPETGITSTTAEAVVVTFSATGLTGPWQLMPGTDVFNNTDQLTASWTTDNITFFYDFNSLTNVPADVYFNVSVIPPAIMKRHPNTNWNNGTEVLALPEVKAALIAHNSNIVPVKVNKAAAGQN